MTILQEPDQGNGDPRKPAPDGRGLVWLEHPEGAPPGRPTPNDPARRCVRIKKNGDRCRRPAIPGGTVCKSHGGLAPQIQQAARVRLERMSEKMAEELLQVALDDAFDGDPRHRTVRLAAINSALDRAGIKPPDKIEVGGSKPFEELLGKVLVKGLSNMSREESRAKRTRSERADGGTDVEEPLDVESEEVPEEPAQAPFERILGKQGESGVAEG
jgi:hypothetical protein